MSRSKPIYHDNNSLGRGRGGGKLNNPDESPWFDNADPLSSRMRRAQNHHVEKQFSGEWYKDWEHRTHKSRQTKRSQNFKAKMNAQKETKNTEEPKKEDNVQVSAQETASSDEFLYDMV